PPNAEPVALAAGPESGSPEPAVAPASPRPWASAAGAPSSSAYPAANRPPAVATYVVAPGDTLTSVASRFGVNVETVQFANNLASTSVLQIGQPLQVPAVAGPLYVVQPGESLAEIAERYGVDLE